jgi:hypothetical protein
MCPNESYKKWHKPKSHHILYNEDGSLKKGKTHEGFYTIKNKEKYIGDTSLVIYRSAWEFAFCKWCDYSPSILKWSSEPIKIPYYDRVSKLNECKKYGLDPNNPANWTVKYYNTDFWIEIAKGDGDIEKWYVEIKPKDKLKRPEPVPENSKLSVQKKYNKQAKEFLINEAKFAAMGEFAKRNNAKFYVFTEDQLMKLGIIGGRFDLQINNKRDF